MNSPIKYFGGKGCGLGKTIYLQFPETSQFDTYIEPFGGGASLLFIKEPNGCEIYNDLEENVYSLFKVLSDEDMFYEFKNMCDITFYSKKIRSDFIKDLKNSDLSMVERAYKFFMVNRMSINGIGGFSVTTNYIRRKMSKSVSDFLSSIDGLDKVHDRLSRVIIENVDGIELIKKYDRKNVFIYADPPYHHDTRTNARYKVDMDNDKQKELIDALLSVKNAMVLLSGYNCDENERLVKKGWVRTEIEVNTVGGDRKPKTKTEHLWKNYQMIAANKTPLKKENHKENIFFN